MRPLTANQEQVLQFIQKCLKRGGPFPSLRDIAGQFGYARTTARFHILALEKKGYVSRRSHRVSDYILSSAEESEESEKSEEPNEEPQNGFERVATISAGAPIEAFEQSGDYIRLTPDYFSRGDLKAVTVSGESMAGDFITDGDIAIIRLQKTYNKRDILALRVGGEITLKRIRVSRHQVDLIPSNPDFEVRQVSTDQVEIIGRLVGITRKY